MGNHKSKNTIKFTSDITNITNDINGSIIKVTKLPPFYGQIKLLKENVGYEYIINLLKINTTYTFECIPSTNVEGVLLLVNIVGYELYTITSKIFTFNDTMIYDHYNDKEIRYAILFEKCQDHRILTDKVTKEKLNNDSKYFCKYVRFNCGDTFKLLSYEELHNDTYVVKKKWCNDYVSI